MSGGWDDYCKNLAAVGMTTSAVLGLNGTVYAQKGDALTAAQVQKLVSRPALAPSTEKGREQLQYAGHNFMFVRKDENDLSIFGKASGQNGGIVLAWAKTVMLVAIYDEKVQSGNATKEVLKLRDHLRASNL